ncbi:MGMT family protein [Quadrisphaera setariae]|nr:MGMT family protein [Quadrisphaera setariae]
MGRAAAGPAQPAGARRRSDPLTPQHRQRPPGRAYIDDVGPLVLAIPEGMALTYGDVAELTGWGAARAVGAVMSQHGHELPWWRVVRADGSLPEGLVPRAMIHWADEGHPLVLGTSRLDLARCRWDGPEDAPA